MALLLRSVVHLEMMNLARCLVLVSMVYLLSGCISCQMKSFYQAQADDRGVKIYAESPWLAKINVDGVDAWVSVCPEQHPRPSMIRLCISLELGESTSMRFSEPKLTISTESARSQDVRLSDVEYEIFCQTENDKRTCTSAEESPVVGQLAVRKATNSIDRYAFDSSLEFHGAKDTLHEGQWFGHRLTGKRLYTIKTFPVDVDANGELSVSFPQWVVNGEKFLVPTLKFRPVTKQVCREVPFQ